MTAAGAGALGAYPLVAGDLSALNGHGASKRGASEHEPGPAVDHALVARLRGVVVQDLSAERHRRLSDGRAELTRDDERRMGRSLLIRALSDRRREQLSQGIPLPSDEDDERVLAAAYAALFGLGRLQSLIDDQSLSEINVNGCDGVWLTYDDGTKLAGPPVADSDSELVDWVRNVATYTGISSRAWDATNWKLELALPDGSRLVGLLGASARPMISIRLRRRPGVTLDALRRLGDFDGRLQRFLEAAVDARMNLVVSGETGSGKTTLVKALAARIGPYERVVTVEHFRELGLDEDPVAHPDAVALEERLPNAEGQGAITLSDCVVASRRMNPDRLIVGEVVGPEIVAWLDGMTQGNDGGITTIHSRSGRDVPQRVATYASRVGMSLEASLLLTATALDFIVHIVRERIADGRTIRYVASVVEVGSYDGHGVVTSEVFRAEPGQSIAAPAADVSPERGAVLRAHGWNPTVDHLDDAPAGGGVW